MSLVTPSSLLRVSARRKLRFSIRLEDFTKNNVPARDCRRGTMARMYTRVAALIVLTSSFLVAQRQPATDMKGTSQEAFVFEQLKESVRFENDGSGVRET